MSYGTFNNISSEIIDRLMSYEDLKGDIFNLFASGKYTAMDLCTHLNIPFTTALDFKNMAVIEEAICLFRRHYLTATNSRTVIDPDLYEKSLAQITASDDIYQAISDSSYMTKFFGTPIQDSSQYTIRFFAEKLSFVLFNQMMGHSENLTSLLTEFSPRTSYQ